MKTRRGKRTKKNPPVESIKFPGLFDEDGPELGLANLSSVPTPPSAAESETDECASASTEELSDNKNDNYSVGKGGEGLQRYWHRSGDGDSSCSSDTTWIVDGEVESGSDTDWSADDEEEDLPQEVPELLVRGRRRSGK